MDSLRVSREDVEEWGDESTRVEVSPLGGTPVGGMGGSGKKGKGKEVRTPGSLEKPTAEVVAPGLKSKNRTSPSKPPTTKPPTTTKPPPPSASASASKTVPPPPTFNAQYEINPDANGGLGYKYEEVVRGKHKRSKMCAVDCEDCRAVSSSPLRPALFVSATFSVAWGGGWLWVRFLGVIFLGLGLETK